MQSVQKTQQVGFRPKHPVVRDLCNGFWELVEPLTYTDPAGKAWPIPAGLKTDFGSIPDALEWIPGLEPWGTEGDPPYVLHDSEYQRHRTGESNRTRKEVDDQLHESLRVCGVGRVRAAVIYYGVRAGGWIAWERKGYPAAPIQPETPTRPRSS